MKSAVALGIALALAGCADAAESTPRPLTAQDSALADALVTLMLAEARAETTGAAADPLRAEAYALTAARHGLDSTAVATALTRLGREPDDAEPILRLVSDRLDLERRGLVP